MKVRERVEKEGGVRGGRIEKRVGRMSKMGVVEGRRGRGVRKGKEEWCRRGMDGEGDGRGGKRMKGGKRDDIRIVEGVEKKEK
jgi:hypothetical protein